MATRRRLRRRANASHAMDKFLDEFLAGTDLETSLVYCAFKDCPVRSNCRRGDIELPVPQHINRISLSEFRPDQNGKCHYQIVKGIPAEDLLGRILELGEKE